LIMNQALPKKWLKALGSKNERCHLPHSCASVAPSAVEDGLSNEIRSIIAADERIYAVTPPLLPLVSWLIADTNMCLNILWIESYVGDRRR
jgi:hypothetical protein